VGSVGVVWGGGGAGWAGMGQLGTVRS
jgi:hypothetical protein